ncbi:MAG: CBASS oligonucleotide cyclase [Hyphomicrobium sp.]
MALTNTQLLYYDGNVLRLPQDKRTEYHAQVDRLIAELGKSLRGRTKIVITKVVKAGSFAKHTILRQTSEDPVDIDVVFYISGRSISSETLQSLRDTIFELLIEIYPNKAVEDFEIQRRAATVTFVGSGLSIDVVPVIEDPSRAGYGWQFDIHGDPPIQTCAPCQIKFVRDRKDADSKFRTLVRLGKRWRNYAELKPLKSFTIELIMAHLLARDGTKGTIDERFRAFLLYLAQSGLKERISFPENQPPLGVFNGPVVILDPVYSKNNVAARITEVERAQIVAKAQEDWETANFASAEDDLDVWKEIFGRRFKVED